MSEREPSTRGAPPMSLHIGKAGVHRFELPLDVATWAMAIHGVRGKGKTSTAVVIVEEALKAGVQCCVLDPTDVWHGLRSSRDGKRAGHPVVILGGSHGDLPLHPQSGRVVADFVVEHPVPVILSLRHLRKGEAQRFVTDFAEQLYHRKGEAKHRRPLLLVIDEASRFVPQKVMGETARLVGAIEDIVRQGRASGFGVILVDQRPASVNKDVLTQIELLVCHAVTSPQDRKALDEWIQGKDSAGHRGEFLEHLASLERGEAWFWLPMSDVFARVHVRSRDTFDSSRTPEIGEAPVAPERFAQVDLGALEEAFQEAVRDAEANDPKALKKRIAELERELKSVRAGAGLTREEAEALAQERAERAVEAAIAGLRSQVRPHVLATKDAADALFHALANGSAPPSPAAPPVRAKGIPAAPRERAPRPAPAPRRAAAPRERPSSFEPTADLARGERQILTAVAQHEGGVTREQLSVLTAYKRSSRDTYLQKLGARGLVHTDGGVIRVTDEGLDALGPDFEPLPTGDELREHWLARLPQGERIILEKVIEAYPDAITREELSDATDYKRSSRDTYLQKLGARRLVVSEGRGSVRASDELFD